MLLDVMYAHLYPLVSTILVVLQSSHDWAEERVQAASNTAAMSSTRLENILSERLRDRFEGFDLIAVQL